MVQLRFKSEMQRSDGLHVNVGLSVISFQDAEGVYLVYCPGLDLYGSGNTAGQAKSSFKEALEEFVRYSINKNTLDSELRKLGWRVVVGKKKRSYEEPSFARLIRTNEDLQRIVNDNNYSKYKQSVDIPVFA